MIRVRQLLHDLRAGCASNDASPAVEEQWLDIACDWNDVRVRLLRPVGVTGPLPVIAYVDGGGWMLGDWLTHDRLLRELAVGAWVEYDRSHRRRGADHQRPLQRCPARLHDVQA